MNTQAIQAYARLDRARLLAFDITLTIVTGATVLALVALLLGV